MKSTVSLLTCRSYEASEVEARLAEALERCSTPDFKGAVVLVKPNLLNANGYEKAVTSHPEFLRATIGWLKTHGAARILVGDSPAFQGQDLVGRKSGIREAAEDAGAEWVDFGTGRERENPEGRLVKRFDLAAPLFEADFLVDLPRMKTHQLMYYSGAIKNLFGLIPGLGKSAFHLRFPERAQFGTMLADLALAAPPDLSILDGVVAMEGPGPNNGSPKKLDLILASRDPLALDWVAAELMGYEPAAIPYLGDLMGRESTAAAKSVRSRWVATSADIELSGLEMAAAKPAHFLRVPVIAESLITGSAVPGVLHRALKAVMLPRPVFDHAKCVRCGACLKICPAKALSQNGGSSSKIVIDYGACLRCYCCHEVCPEDAIRLVRRPF